MITPRPLWRVKRSPSPRIVCSSFPLPDGNSACHLPACRAMASQATPEESHPIGFFADEESAILGNVIAVGIHEGRATIILHGFMSDPLSIFLPPALTALQILLIRVFAGDNPALGEVISGGFAVELHKILGGRTQEETNAILYEGQHECLIAGPNSF